MAVFISNIPEGLSASEDLADAGLKRMRILGLWVLVVAVSALAAAFGFGVLGKMGPHVVVLLDSFAAGAILAMLAESMIPEAYEQGGRAVGPRDDPGVRDRGSAVVPDVSIGWRDVVERFAMAAHPEGGWYVETWRADPPPGGAGRPIASAILFLLPAGEESRWHRVDADELWQYSAGDPLELRIAPSDGGPVSTTSARPGRHGRRRGPGRGAGGRVAGGAPAGRVDPRGLRRGAGLLVRWVRARSRGLGAGLTI